MPTLTTTIEDTSPVIIYSGSSGSDWVAGTSATDPSADKYSQSSFMVTQTARADVSFYFYGTGVQLYGAKRQNHGAFQISIDSVVYPPVNGSVSYPEAFQTALFTTAALSNGYHTVRMTNLESRYLDLDFITWQTPVGQANEPLIATTVQDTDPSFKYTPEEQWNSSPAVNAGMFSGGSGHVTSTAGALVEYTFNVSDSVALYGPVGPNGAPFSVQLDNDAAKNFSSYKLFYRPQMILFQASNLGGGQHTVKLMSTAWNNSALTLSIDYAQVYTTPSLQKSSGLSTGAIVGISIGAVLLALLTVIVIFRRLWPSIFKNVFRLKGRSYQNHLVTEAFEYRPISANESTSSHGLTTTQAHRLTTQLSQSSFHPTPPSTGLLPISGEGSYRPSMYADTMVPGPNTQVITIPYTPDGKYRPDLLPAPQLMPPPQGLRRSGSTTVQTSTLQVPSSSTAAQQPRSSRSQPNLLAALPPGARQPVPGVSLDNLRGVAGRTEVQQAVLTPLRGPGRREGPPPQYERDPS